MHLLSNTSPAAISACSYSASANRKPLATLSLDLDNRWSYLKTYGDPAWDAAETYLPTVVPRILAMMREKNLTITVFIVGRDADDPENHDALRAIAQAGHEIGNHSYHHEPWLHRYTAEQLHEEIVRAELAIERATGCRPRGFRGPGFSHSPATWETLASLHYLYDASSLATFIGPLARAYYLLRSPACCKEEREKRQLLFGRWREGLRPNRPYWLATSSGRLLEIPVTTIPFLRLPMHLSYLLYLSRWSESLADAYCRLALTLCRVAGVPPSWLLHPLDFLGADDAPDLGFFPAMDLPANIKLARLSRWLDWFARSFEVVPLYRLATELPQRCVVFGETRGCSSPRI